MTLPVSSIPPPVETLLGSGSSYYPILGEILQGSSNALVISHLLSHPDLGREELSKELGLSVVEVSIVCRHLSKAGVLIKSKKAENIPWCVFRVDENALREKITTHRLKQKNSIRRGSFSSSNNH